MTYDLFRLVKKGFHLLGFDIKRLSNTPGASLLGIRNLPIRTVIDIGANEGQFSRSFLHHFPDARFFCFEPAPEPFRKLEAWSAEQKGRIQAFNLALGDADGMLQMFSHTAHSPSSSLLATTETCHELYQFTREQSRIPVTVTTLDTFLKKHDLELVPDICIKLDVQGFEDRVIRGGKKTFERAKACILEVCLDPLYKDQAKFPGIIGSMHDLGFRYAGNLEQIFAPDGHVVFIDAVFLK